MKYKILIANAIFWMLVLCLVFSAHAETEDGKLGPTSTAKIQITLEILESVDPVVLDQFAKAGKSIKDGDKVAETNGGNNIVVNNTENGIILEIE